MPERRSRTLLWILVGGGAFLVYAFVMLSLAYMTLRASGNQTEFGTGFGDSIAVVDLDGIILSPHPVVEQLKRFADDSSVKAIILHVNSPGGGVAASEEIYREVKRIREEKKKPVVVSIETVGASGAYYIASASSKIYADQGSIVGSIGVIAEWVNYGDLLRWAKLKSVVLKTGEFKDTGNPARDLTPAEQAYMQSLIDNMFGQFIHAVADGRGMKYDDVKAIANGKVWTGEQAASMKLIDNIGDFEAAVKDTAKSVGITGEPTLVRPERERRMTLLDWILGDAAKYLPDRESALEQQVGFYYLWK
jgi:protease IV